MSAAAFPNWAMLEQFVFRRDGKKSFPDSSTAPIRASGTTSWGAKFRVAFVFAEPPRISRLYARLRGFPGPNQQVPLAFVATHRRLILLRVGKVLPSRVRLQDLFVYSAGDPSSLQAIPHCTLPEMNITRRDPRLPQELHTGKARLLALKSLGLLCRGEDEFVVVELKLFKFRRTEVYADIYLLRSSTSSAGPGLSPRWQSMRLPIRITDNTGISENTDDYWQLCLWQTEAVVPFDQWLCWIDHCRGILFCDVFGEPTPTVTFLRFPLGEFPTACDRRRGSSWLYRGVTAIDVDGHALMFVDVARNDDIGYGELKPGAGFTITCYKLIDMVWVKEYNVTSEELWNANPPERLPRTILMFPQVDINKPHIVHFLISSYGKVMKKMWVVSINMETKIVESFYQYINGFDDRGTMDADLTTTKSGCPLPFLPCEFPKFLHSSRKRKDME
ncbi:hypothetical protein ACP70R_010711 [Stipagrostis hirtigluma subsp. patula]